MKKEALEQLRQMRDGMVAEKKDAYEEARRRKEEIEAAWSAYDEDVRVDDNGNEVIVEPTLEEKIAKNASKGTLIPRFNNCTECGISSALLVDGLCGSCRGEVVFFEDEQVIIPE